MTKKTNRCAGILQAMGYHGAVLISTPMATATRGRFDNLVPSIGDASHYEDFLRETRDEDIEISTSTCTEGSFSHISFYLYNAHTFVIPTFVLISGMLCWRHRRKMLQQQAHQQALATFIEALGERLPIPDWESTVSSDHTGFTITYTFQLEDYLSIQENNASWSVSQSTFKKYFETVYLRVNTPLTRCSISKNNCNESFELILHIARPVEEFFEQDQPLPRETLKNSMQRARTKFLAQVKPQTAESKVSELLVQKDELLTERKADDDEFDTLLNPWLSNPGQWQEAIHFIEKEVLVNHKHLLSTTGIINCLSQLRTANFNQLSLKEKLTALLWLYRQLETIAQMIDNPQSIVVYPPGDSENAKFYRPFAWVVKQQASNGRKLAQDLQHQIPSFIAEKYSMTDRPEIDFKVEEIMDQLRDLIEIRNQKRNRFTSEWSKKFNTEKSLNAQEKHKQAEKLEAFISDIKSSRILNKLPQKMEKFFNILTGEHSCFWKHRIQLSQSNQRVIIDEHFKMLATTNNQRTTEEEKQEAIGHFFTQSGWLVEKSRQDAVSTLYPFHLQLRILSVH